MKFLLSIPKRIIDFFKSVVQELKHVRWLSAKETTRLSTIVVITVILFGIFLVGIDRVLNVIVVNIFEKLV
jgi:preprotein translocase SecE subunit